ncbi:hypothetical protein BS78_03G253700 [Paspalum vaginatum]|nr:hypothetical protein BS78_03G253700 [Paspalum vaginatum]
MSSSMNNPRHQYSLKEDLTRAVKAILVFLWFTIPLWILILRFLLPPKFSVQVVGATGLESPPPAQHNAPVSTVFNITLHTANRRSSGRCYRNGEVAVRYSGYTVAWGRTMAFCVGEKAARQLPLVAWADGVSLPSSLRERMAEDWRAGAAELEVDLRLFRGDDGSVTPAWVSCKATAGGAKPPGVTPCTTFASQNWASDIAPAWMQYF